NYGLGHQNEDFNTHLTSSCMEYTSDPVGNEHPDGHDYDQLDTIYNHVDDTSGGGSSSGGPGNGKGGGKGKKLGIESGNSPAEWGKAIAQDASGRDSVYARNVNGYTVITHVTWAIGEGPGPRRHSGDHHFD
ncbi:hypothetical protein, partial [Altererythrobacter sp.]|uniref:hypothetical protein n=1 Tax=Altererythrobacter sp. TaxID=1872480 RepID=UPI003D0F0807